MDDAEFIGACCMQLVEMVITLRRDGEPDASTAPAIATACLRLLGLPEDEVAKGSRGGRGSAGRARGLTVRAGGAQ